MPRNRRAPTSLEDSAAAARGGGGAALARGAHTPADRLPSQELGNWKLDDFALRILGDRVLGADRDKQDVVAADKVTLQSYGRPYAAGKPSGTYYKYARTETVPSWVC